MRGPLQLGALLRISEHCNEKYLHKIFLDGIYGISIGAIIGVFIAFGFSIDELHMMLSEFSQIQNILEPIRLESIIGFQANYGIEVGEKIHTFLIDKFSKKDLHLPSLKISEALVPLHIIATDLTNTKPVIFSGNTYVWDALRASFALPFVFTPHIIGSTTYVDGAELCTDISTAVKDPMNTLFLLCSQLNKTDYFSRVFNIHAVRGIKKILKKYPQNTCCLEESDTPYFYFWNISETFQALIDRGYECMNDFFTKCTSQEFSEH